MGGFHWSDLSPVQQFFSALLIWAAAAGTLTVGLLVLKLAVELKGYWKTIELTSTAHDLLRVSAKLNEDTRAKAGRVEQDVEQIKAAVTAGADARAGG